MFRGAILESLKGITIAIGPDICLNFSLKIFLLLGSKLIHAGAYDPKLLPKILVTHSFIIRIP